MNPNDKVQVHTPGVGTESAHETYKDANLGHLPGHILFGFARNESASREWRKAAVELLIDKHCPQAGHPELAVLVNEIRAEREARNEVESIVETAIESEIPQSPALTASVTTATMQLPQAQMTFPEAGTYLVDIEVPEPIISNALALNEDALGE